MSALSRSVVRLNSSHPTLPVGYSFVLKAYFKFEDKFHCQYFGIDNSKHLQELQEILRKLDFFAYFAVGNVSSINDL